MESQKPVLHPYHSLGIPSRPASLQRSYEIKPETRRRVMNRHIQSMDTSGGRQTAPPNFWRFTPLNQISARHRYADGMSSIRRPQLEHDAFHVSLNGCFGNQQM
jgi:hypothetical protein